MNLGRRFLGTVNKDGITYDRFMLSGRAAGTAASYAIPAFNLLSAGGFMNGRNMILRSIYFDYYYDLAASIGQFVRSFALIDLQFTYATANVGTVHPFRLAGNPLSLPAPNASFVISGIQLIDLDLYVGTNNQLWQCVGTGMPNVAAAGINSHFLIFSYIMDYCDVK